MPRNRVRRDAIDYLFRFITQVNLANQGELDALIAELEQARTDALDPATRGFINNALALASVRWLDRLED